MRKTDEKLVGDFIAGEEKALEALVDRYLKPLYGFVFQFVKDESAAQDIVQEAFVKMWGSINSFDCEKKFSTWIFAIAKNTAFDHLKKKKTVSFSAFENWEGENILECIEDEKILHSWALLEKMDNEKDVQEFLDALSPQLRTILFLHHTQGFSLSEIAEILGEPQNTTKSKYRRAIISLREKFSSRNSAIKIAPESDIAS